MRLIEGMRWIWGVIKATPNKKCYTWYANNMHAWQQLLVFKHRDHAFITVEFKDSALLKDSVIFGHHVFYLHWYDKLLSTVALSCLGYAFTMTINCSAGYWGTCSSHSLDSSFFTSIIAPLFSICMASPSAVSVFWMGLMGSLEPKRTVNAENPSEIKGVSKMHAQCVVYSCQVCMSKRHTQCSVQVYYTPWSLSCSDTNV